MRSRQYGAFGLIVCVAALAGSVAGATEGGGEVGYPQFPSLSPDGAVVVYAWAGDLWGAPATGGASNRLTVHPAEERRSAFSPDGSMLAFESNRDGARNIYVMPVRRTVSGGLLAGAARRITASDKTQLLGGFSPDGKSIYFTSNIEPTIYRTTRIYRVEVDGPADGAAAGGVSGGPVTLVSPAFAMNVRPAGDGSAMVFSRGYCPAERPEYRGSGQHDVWRMNMADGTFVALTTSPANDFEPAPLPDGSTVFISARDGQNNLWRVGPGGEGQGAATRLTSFRPTREELSIGAGVRDLAVSGNGKTAAFCVWDRLYRLDLTDAKAAPVAVDLAAQGDDVTLDVQRMVLDREVSESVLSPDGRTLAVGARGGIFVRNTGENYPTRRVTSTAGRERDIAWSADGRVLYFASDDAGLAGGGGGGGNLGKESIYQAGVDLAREDIAPPKAEEKKDEAKREEAEKKKDEGEKKDDAKGEEKKDDDKKDEKKDAEKPAAERRGTPKKVDYGKRWAESLRFAIEPVLSDAKDLRNPTPSPDARCLLVTRSRGDLVLVELKGMTQRVLFEGWNSPDVRWAGDSRHIVYAVEDLDFNSDIWLLDTGGFDSFAEGSKFTRAPAVNLTRHPDDDGSPRLSADGKVLTFLSQRGEQSDQMDVYQVYLDKGLEGMTAYEREDYFKRAGEAAGKRKPAETPAWVPVPARVKALMKEEKQEEKKEEAKAEEGKKAEGGRASGSEGRTTRKAEPMRFDAEDAYLRIRRITTSAGGKGSLEATPGADRLIFSGTFDDAGPSLVSVDHKGGDRRTIVAGAVGGLSVSLTGDKVVFIKSGTVSSAPTKGGKVEGWPVDAPVAVSIERQARQKFLEAARTFGQMFYHPTMKGLDWEGLTRRYLALAAKTRTGEEFNRVTQTLFGETNGSHTGIVGGSAFNAGSTQTGYLGVRVRPVAGGYEVVHVAEDSPASLKSSRIYVGDVIVAVDSKRLAPDAASMPTLDLDGALLGRSGRETLVEVKRAAVHAPKDDGAEAKDGGEEEASGSESRTTPPHTPPRSPFVVITPVSGAAWTVLRYDEEVAARRAMAERLSGGKIGYLHIRAMSGPEVRDFERDLFAAGNGKEGLIIDVRDNGGGFTADILLSSLTAPRHAYTVPRGADPASVPHDAYPRDRRLIYGWTRPIDVLINEHSFSNAEIFAHAIKTTGRGRLIGTATFGGVISTGAFSLIDGTTVRMPFRGWYLPDGTDMENHGARPDVDVAQVPGDEVSGKDAQLEAAVEDLMKRVGK